MDCFNQKVPLSKTAPQAGFSIVSFLVAIALAGMAMVVLALGVSNNIANMRSIAARQGSVRLEAIVRGSLANQMKSFLDARINASTLASITGSQVITGLGTIASPAEGMRLIVVDGSSVTVPALAPGAPASVVAARTRCNGGQVINAAAGFMYNCFLYNFASSVAVSSQSSVDLTHPVFVETYYGLRNVSSGQSVTFAGASAATDLGAAMYYTIYWKGIGADFKTHPGLRYVIHKP